MRNARHLFKKSGPSDPGLPPFALMPTNIEQLDKVVKTSTPEFWAFFNSVPPEERDKINYAANGPVLRSAYASLVQRFY